jgi:hypothetical protein
VCHHGCYSSGGKGVISGGFGGGSGGSGIGGIPGVTGLGGTLPVSSFFVVSTKSLFTFSLGIDPPILFKNLPWFFQ